jgi:putative flippase GtrA
VTLIEQRHKWTIAPEQEIVRRKANSFVSNRVSPMDGGTFSAWGLSVFRRPFVCRGSGKDSYLASIASNQLFKFLIVGAFGVVVNLLLMVLLIQAGNLRDWRASTIASAIATLHNYLLNNRWTFGDRRRNGRALFNGAFLYFPVAALGIALTAMSYSMLTHLRFRTSFGTSPLYLLGAQLVSILFGTYLNYSLHTLFTWRRGSDEA